MLSRAAITFAVAVATLVSGGATDLRAGNSRFEIAPDDVIAAVRARGASVGPEQVSFPAAVTASNMAPGLHVTESRRIGKSETAVRLACDSSAVCLPFYVILRGLDAEQELLLSRPVGTRAKSPARAEKPCIRSGDRASLILENPQMRITLQVIALQNGRLGETIRATDTERKRVYRAEVSGPGLLKSAL